MEEHLISPPPLRGGCSIQLCLPLVHATSGKGSQETTKVDRHIDSHDDNRKNDDQGRRVLFVDDHEVIRQGIISMLDGQPGLVVVGEATIGQQALDLTREVRPDVIVMDISMPVMDGIEATRRIKKEFPDIRVVGLSMQEDEQVIDKMYKVGADFFINKTASPGELLKAIYQDD